MIEKSPESLRWRNHDDITCRDLLDQLREKHDDTQVHVSFNISVYFIAYINVNLDICIPCHSPWYIAHNPLRKQKFQHKISNKMLTEKVKKAILVT